MTHVRGSDVGLAAPALTEADRSRTFVALVAVVVAAAMLAAGVTGTGDLASVGLSPALVVGALVAAALGRLVALGFQLEVVDASLSRATRMQRSKVALLAAVVMAQWPLALRDAGLGLVGLTGLLSTSAVLSLAANPLDPFLAASVAAFARSARASVPDRVQRRRAIIAFAGFAVVSKVLNGLLMSMLQGSLG